MCKRFDIADVYTESDNEADNPLCYEEIFNVPVSAMLTASPSYSAVWNVYSNTNGTFTKAVTNIKKDTTFKDYLRQNFLMSNNVIGYSSFNRSDYYRFDIAVDDVVHNRSVLSMQDMINDMPNTMHSPFNCILYCVNSAFDNTTSKATNGVPAGMDKAIPICMSCNTDVMILAGSAVTIEPALNGIITVE